MSKPAVEQRELPSETRGRKTKYPWDTCTQVGDSFFVPERSRTGRGYKSLHSTVNYWRGKGKVFKVEDGHKRDMLRCLDCNAWHEEGTKMCDDIHCERSFNLRAEPNTSGCVVYYMGEAK